MFIDRFPLPREDQTIISVHSYLFFPLSLFVMRDDSTSLNRLFDRFHPMPDIVHIDAA